MAPEERTEAAALLRSFERRFLAARALRSFPWQSLEEKLRGSSDSEQLLVDILQKTVQHPICARHPPSKKYTQSFVLELIRKHEAVHTEPSDELYEALAEVLTAEEPSQCHRSYVLPSGAVVTLAESTAIVSHGTTGLVTWDAALYLAEWAIKNPAAFAHRTVLELGSGAGLTGLAICKSCHPRAYIFSDCHCRVLQQLRENVALNGFSLQPEPRADTQRPLVTVAQLDWDTATTPELAAIQPDIIIAADVLYCPEVTRSLVKVLHRLSICLKDRVPDVYVAFTMRNPDTYQLFTIELGRAEISWETVPPHNRKLFPYEEGSETAMLRLRLEHQHREAWSPSPQGLCTEAEPVSCTALHHVKS
ncbi:protein-lysine N-methyltransferase EEF2KMT [Perognathus longimembris pacificus]|uniref:protein-lysine N-methyltransferase EEF2KMT n=1 Tax=Perognathus longimembris pacificus TaxID=214514 RepID=UPI0020199ED2|nr:protein-lysine N-methyltransferase EEF2KMT [Perognathus longimembris pacificus]